MEKYPQVILSIRGLLEPSTELLPFADRIERRPFIAWQKLVSVTADSKFRVYREVRDSPLHTIRSV